MSNPPKKKVTSPVAHRSYEADSQLYWFLWKSCDKYNDGNSGFQWGCYPPILQGYKARQVCHLMSEPSDIPCVNYNSGHISCHSHFLETNQ